MYVYVQCITYYEHLKHVETAQNLPEPLKTVPSPGRNPSADWRVAP